MIWALIPSKLKLYGLIALTVILGMVGVYFKGAENAKVKLRLKTAVKRAEAMKKAKKVRTDAESDSDDNILDDITR